MERHIIGKDLNVKKENAFQAKLIKDIKNEFPGAVILKNDANYIQGFPDLTILYKNKWAVLECKKSAKEIHQPNQDDYIFLLNNMSFSAFIYPENRDSIMEELRLLFN